MAKVLSDSELLVLLDRGLDGLRRAGNSLRIAENNVRKARWALQARQAQQPEKPQPEPPEQPQQELHLRAAPLVRALAALALVLGLSASGCGKIEVPTLRIDVEVHSPQPATNPRIDVPAIIENAALACSEAKYFKDCIDEQVADHSPEVRNAVALYQEAVRLADHLPRETGAGVLLAFARLRGRGLATTRDVHAFERAGLPRSIFPADSELQRGTVSAHDIYRVALAALGGTP